ncbi:MAG: DUF4956 domain-containing protein [Reichenbachiella sp.]|uniref:DUF4956 domain-containing protein n=1 Tax=Reichenbachiella sp. TaxID=2184521 RepID=UPI00329A126E
MNQENTAYATFWEGIMGQVQATGVEEYDFALLFIRLFINLTSLVALIWLIHKRNHKSTDFYFSYFAIGMTVFLLCFLLSNVKLELGFALGLFAIFGIIRYRTDAIPIKEMSFLFVVIGISVVNALVNNKIDVSGLALINAVIVLMLWCIEKVLNAKNQRSIPILYENIENIHLVNQSILIEDLKKRTGLCITSFEIIEIDYLRDVAQLVIFYREYKK